MHVICKLLSMFTKSKDIIDIKAFKGLFKLDVTWYMDFYVDAILLSKSSFLIFLILFLDLVIVGPSLDMNVIYILVRLQFYCGSYERHVRIYRLIYLAQG